MDELDLCEGVCPDCGDRVGEEDFHLTQYNQCEACFDRDHEDEEECPDCGEPMDEGECPYWCDRDESDED